MAWMYIFFSFIIIELTSSLMYFNKKETRECFSAWIVTLSIYVEELCCKGWCESMYCNNNTGLTRGQSTPHPPVKFGLNLISHVACSYNITTFSKYFSWIMLPWEWRNYFGDFVNANLQNFVLLEASEVADRHTAGLSHSIYLLFYLAAQLVCVCV